jgi:two-component system CheB/CheR fusion protein
MDGAKSTADVSGWIERVLLHTRDHAVILIDPDGNMIGWHGAAERLFGHSAAEVFGRPFAMIFVPEDRALALHVQELDVALWLGRSEDDRWHLRKDGGRFWGSGVIEPVFSVAGTLQGYCKVLRDRSDVRTQLDSLQNALERRQEELSARENEAARWAHEIRNTAGPILNAVRMLQSSDDPSIKRHGCELLERQVTVMRRLLDDLLRKNGNDEAQVELHRERVVLGEALEFAVSAVRAVAAERQIELRLLVPAGPLVLDADPVRLQQMLSNLLGNALKYTGPGGHVALTATIEGSEAVIRCEDDGVGIAPDMLPRIFDLFSREDTSRSAPEGMGVGLAVVRDYAALHGGGVEARSAGKGKGTVVALRLPLRAPAQS